jgi:hypothetical protein
LSVFHNCGETDSAIWESCKGGRRLEPDNTAVPYSNGTCLGIIAERVRHRHCGITIRNENRCRDIKKRSAGGAGAASPARAGEGGDSRPAAGTIAVRAESRDWRPTCGTGSGANQGRAAALPDIGWVRVPVGEFLPQLFFSTRLHYLTALRDKELGAFGGF